MLFVFQVLKSFQKIRIIFFQDRIIRRCEEPSFSAPAIVRQSLCIPAAVADFRSRAAKRKVAVGMPNQQQSFIEIALVKRTACFLATLYTRNIVHFLKYCSCRRQRHRCRHHHRRLC
jgi:hypothetical protein